MKDVDYSKIIQRSWEITKKNKWLWVTGMVIAVFGGGSGSGGGGGGSSSGTSTSVPSDSSSPMPIEDIKDKTSYVLGIATDSLQNWFSNFPTINWFILGLIVFFVIIFGTVVIWILTSWAKGALIQGLEDADNEKEVTLKSISPYGISNIKKLMIFGLISFGMSLILFLGVSIFVGIGYLIYSFAGSSSTILLVLLGILLAFIFIILIAIFTMISVYAERLMVLKGLVPWEAWKKGFSLSKGNFFPTFIMGIINSIIGFSVGCLGMIALLILFAIPGFLIIYPIFKDGFKFPSQSQIFAIIVLFFLFTSINIAIKAVFTVFNYGNWNLFFKQIINKEEKLI
jgi:hypothetical protein